MNQKHNNTKLSLFITAILFLTGFSISNSEADTASTSHIPKELIASNLKTHDHSLAISVAAVVYKKKQKHHITLIDIRSRQDFERLHIPGSLNIPLYAIKTKTYLKSAIIILVNEGIDYGPLETEAQRLAERGFKVQILDGGLPAWHRRGRELTGDLFALEEMKTISPKIFFREKDYEDTLVIDISATQTDASAQLIPYAKHLPLSDGDDDLDADGIENHIPAIERMPFQTVIIFNETGEQYEKARSILNCLGMAPYILQGGLDGYREYLRGLMLSWKPRDDRMKTVSNCRPCGERIEEKSSLRNN